MSLFCVNRKNKDQIAGFNKAVEVIGDGNAVKLHLDLQARGIDVITDEHIASFQRAKGIDGSIKTIPDLLLHLTGRSNDYNVKAKKIQLKMHIIGEMERSKIEGNGSAYYDKHSNTNYTVSDIGLLNTGTDAQILEINTLIDQMVDQIYNKKNEYAVLAIAELIDFYNGQITVDKLSNSTKNIYDYNVKGNLLVNKDEVLYHFKDIGEIDPNYADLIPLFEGFNPIVIYDQRNKRIRLFLLSTFIDHFAETSSEHLSQFITKDVAVNNNFVLKSSLMKQEVFVLSILNAMLNYKNPAITIDPFGILQLKSGAKTSVFSLFNYLGEISYMIKDNRINEKLEGPLKEIFNYPNLFDESKFANDPYLLVQNILFQINQGISINNTGSDVDDSDKSNDRYAVWLAGLQKASENRFVYKNDIIQILSEILKYTAKRKHYSSYSMYSPNARLFKVASDALLYIESNGKRQFPVRDISTVMRIITPNYETNDPFTQLYFRRFKEAYYTVMAKLRPLVEKSNNAFIEFNKRVGGNDAASRTMHRMLSTLQATDRSAEYFEKMWIDDIGYSAIDKSVEVKIITNRIHHKTNPATVRLLSTLSGEQKAEMEAIAEYGSFILDAFKNLFIQFRYNEIYEYGKDKDVLMERAKAEIENEWDWENGCLPALREPGIESPDIQARFTKFSRSNMAGIEFENELGFIENMPVPSQYASQLGSRSSKLISPSRAKALGLSIDDRGRYVLEDPKKNNELARNIQYIYNIVAGNMLWSQEMNKFVPYFYATMSMVHTFEMQNGNPKLKNIEKLVKDYFEHMVHKRKLILDEKGISIGKGYKLTLDDVVNNINNLVIFSLALGNYMMSSQNLLRNQAQLILKGVQNNFAGYPGLFNEADLTFAYSQMTFNFDKMQNVGRSLNLDVTDYANLIRSLRFNNSKDIVDNYVMTFDSFIGDYVTALLLMTAQMKHDGTWDAYNENGEYDESKDVRWDSENGKVLREYTLNKLKLAGYGHNGDKLLTAYDPDRINFFRVVNSKFVSGPYGETDVVELDFGIIGKMFLRFKKYSIQDVHNALLLVEKSLDQFASLDVVEIEVDGKKQKVVDRVPMHYHGKLLAIVRTLHAAKSLATGDVEEFVKLWNDPVSGRQYRENIFRITADLVVVILPLLFMGIVGSDDDESKKREKAWRASYLYRIYWYGIADVATDLSLRNYINNVTDPFVALKNIKNLYRAAEFAFVFNFEAAEKELTKAFAAKRYIYDRILEPWIMDDPTATERQTTRLK